MTYAIVSDIHAHAWSTYSTVGPDGVNSRLKITLDEWKRAAATLVSAGGRTMVCAGDIFHVRGSLDPEVLNPVQDTVAQILGMGVDIHAIPGNHDLKSNDTQRLSSAVETLARTESDDGCFKVYNAPIATSTGEHNLVFVPWMVNTKQLLEVIAAQTKSLRNPADFDLIIHAGIDGVLSGLPDHGLTAKILKDFGFRNVFAGHYHHHKMLDTGVYSIGATTHQTWSDLDTKAGFLLVDDAGVVKWHDTHAPKFIDISGWDETDIKLEAPGNYIRFRGPAMSAKDLEELKKWLSTLGAKGIQVDVAKVTTSSRSTAAPASGRSLDQSVLAFIDASTTIPAPVDREALKRRAAATLASARALESA